jgi:hypothetical protein
LQQAAERTVIVPRLFLVASGQPADRLRLKVTVPTCP